MSLLPVFIVERHMVNHNSFALPRPSSPSPSCPRPYQPAYKRSPPHQHRFGLDITPAIRTVLVEKTSVYSPQGAVPLYCLAELVG